MFTEKIVSPWLWVTGGYVIYLSPPANKTDKRKQMTKSQRKTQEIIDKEQKKTNIFTN